MYLLPVYLPTTTIVDTTYLQYFDHEDDVTAHNNVTCRPPLQQQQQQYSRLTETTSLTMSVGNNNNRTSTSEIPPPVVNDATAAATVRDGEEHAAVISSSPPSPSLPSNSAAIPTPAAAIPGEAAAVVVEEDNLPQQQQTPYEQAVAHATTIQSKLATLLSQKSQLESSIINEWSTKISTYEFQSFHEMNDELQLLQNRQAKERGVLEEKLRTENEAEDKKLKRCMDEIKEVMDARRRENKKRYHRGSMVTGSSDAAMVNNEKGEEPVVNDNTKEDNEAEEGESITKQLVSRSTEKEKELAVSFPCLYVISFIDFNTSNPTKTPSALSPIPFQNILVLSSLGILFSVRLKHISIYRKSKTK